MLCVWGAGIPEQDCVWTNLLFILDLDAAEPTEVKLMESLLMPNSTLERMFNQTWIFLMTFVSSVTHLNSFPSCMWPTFHVPVHVFWLYPHWFLFMLNIYIYNYFYTNLGGKVVIEVSTDGWWIKGWIIATFGVFLSSQPESVGRGVSNVFSERPVDSAVFQEQTHNWINAPPGFVIDHIYTRIWCSPWEWSDKDGLRFVQL